MRQVEANLKANLAVEASGQAAAGMRTIDLRPHSPRSCTRQYLQVCGDAWWISAACAAVGLVRGCVRSTVVVGSRLGCRPAPKIDDSPAEPPAVSRPPATAVELSAVVSRRRSVVPQGISLIFRYIGLQEVV